MAREHFGITLGESKYGYKLNRENFAIVNNKSSFGNGRIYDDEWCKEKYNRCMQNYDINMQRLFSLNSQDFENEISKFLELHPLFEEVTDLKKYEGVSGYYMMVLDNYCQVYIGTSGNIKQRIINHWNKIVPFDRIIFGNVETSIISIDSYRACDTTRIYVYRTNDTYRNEDEIINSINPIYCCNRTKGGSLSGLDEAIANRKVYSEEQPTKAHEKTNETRIYENPRTDTKYETPKDEILTVTDLTALFHCTRNKIMSLYAMNGLPLEKVGNKYIIKESKLSAWMDMMDKLEKEREEQAKKELLISLIIVFVVILFAIFLASKL